MKSVALAFTLLLILISSPLSAQQNMAFSQYEADYYKGSLAGPDFESNPKASKFRTRIKTACAEGINFAGQYTLVSFGCGTACQTSFVVNRNTGVIYDGITSELGIDFNARSTLLIQNIGAQEMSKEERASCSYCKIKYWTWENDSFVEVNKQ